MGFSQSFRPKFCACIFFVNVNIRYLTLELYIIQFSCSLLLYTGYGCLSVTSNYFSSIILILHKFVLSNCNWLKIVKIVMTTDIGQYFCRTGMPLVYIIKRNGPSKKPCEFTQTNIFKITVLFNIQCNFETI